METVKIDDDSSDNSLFSDPGTDVKELRAKVNQLKKENENKTNNIAQWRKRYGALYEEFHKRNGAINEKKFKKINSSQECPDI
jgi:predicted Zn-dependent protease